MKRDRKLPAQQRKGTITILAAILTVVLVGMVAFCVDIGYVLSAKEELQRSADASALATCWEFAQRLSDGYSATDSATFARVVTAEYASDNPVTGNSMTLNTNSANAPDGDVVFTYAGVVSGDKFTGMAEVAGFQVPYNGVRTKSGG